MHWHIWRGVVCVKWRVRDLIYHTLSNLYCIIMSDPKKKYSKTKVNQWLYMKRLYINLPKTFLNFVFFSKTKSSNNFKFSIDCHLINQTDSIKFWGVFLDSRQLKAIIADKYFTHSKYFTICYRLLRNLNLLSNVAINYVNNFIGIICKSNAR